MWVEKLPNGKFKYCERYKDPITGKSRKVSITLKTNSNIAKNKAIQKLNQKIKDKMNRKAPLKSASFKDVVEQFIVVKEKEIKPSSVFAYKDRLAQVVKEIGDIPMERLTPALLNNLFLEMIKELSYSTVSNRFRLTKNVIEFAVKYGYLTEDNITPHMALPKINRKPRGANDYKYLEPHQWQDLFKNMDDKHPEMAMMFKLQLQTGMRYNELSSLRKRDIDFRNKTINISRTYDNKNKLFTTPKGNEQRKIYFNSDTAKLLKDAIKNSQLKSIATGVRTDLIFFTINGNPISISTANETLHKYDYLFEDLHLTTHIFRHTFITQMVSNGVDMSLVSKHVGHRSVEITQRIYTHFNEKMSKELKEEIARVSF